MVFVNEPHPCPIFSCCCRMHIFLSCLMNASTCHLSLLVIYLYLSHIFTCYVPLLVTCIYLFHASTCHMPLPITYIYISHAFTCFMHLPVSCLTCSISLLVSCLTLLCYVGSCYYLVVHVLMNRLSPWWNIRARLAFEYWIAYHIRFISFLNELYVFVLFYVTLWISSYFVPWWVFSHKLVCWIGYRRNIIMMGTGHCRSIIMIEPRVARRNIMAMGSGCRRNSFCVFDWIVRHNMLLILVFSLWCCPPLWFGYVVPGICFISVDLCYWERFWLFFYERRDYYFLYWIL